MSLIEIKNLKKAFDQKVVLNDLSLSVEKGDSFVVIGGSGTGKSVLIKCIMGLIYPDDGQVLLKGQDVTFSTPSHRQSVLNFGMLFQGGALFDSLSIWENVAFGLIQGRKMDKNQAKKIAHEKLEAVDLPSSVGDLYPSELSGGMQKRAALARAIATNPDVIFFDEPTTGLDPIVSGKINELIKRCVKDLGATAISITHDMASLRTIADKVGLLFKGSLIWSGTVQEMDTTENPYVRQFIHGYPTGPFTSD
ncbi:MAG: putative ribonucleotide transport ATP-binding protein mkl [Holosporales bacterium]